MKLEAIAKLKNLRKSPRKVRLIIDLIRGLKVEKAITELELSTKHAARPILKLLNSAIANSKHNHDLKEETLVIKRAFVDEGVTLHRWMPRAMGRATPLRKRSSHVTLILEGDVDEKAAKKKVDSDKKSKKEVTKKVEKKVEKKVKSKKIETKVENKKKTETKDEK